MNRNQHHDNASSRKKSKICDKGIVRSWSELHHHVLYLVMMQLGIVDFIAFSGVCKSWRSLALSNRKSSNMSVNINGNECRLVDTQGKKFKFIRLRSDNMKYAGSTCGYMIFVYEKPRGVWLVNPITEHKLLFPDVPFAVSLDTETVRAFLVFSPSISRWVFVASSLFCDRIWFCMVGDQKWSNVSTPFRIHDLLAFKGKIYALHSVNCLSEVILYPTPTFTLLENKNLLKPNFERPVFGSSGEKLHVIDRISGQRLKINELNFNEMKWGSQGRYALSFGDRKTSDKYCLRSSRYALKSGTCRVYLVNRCYFLYEFSNVSLQHQ